VKFFFSFNQNIEHQQTTMQQQQQSQQFLLSNAKNLCPIVIPMGVNLQINPNDDDKQQILRELKPNKCMVKNCGVQSNDLHFVMIPELDLTKNTYNVKRAQFMCGNCRQCADLNLFMNQFVTVDNDEMKEYRVCYYYCIIVVVGLIIFFI
jgi:hypothetical protein